MSEEAKPEVENKENVSEAVTAPEAGNGETASTDSSKLRPLKMRNNLNDNHPEFKFNVSGGGYRKTDSLDSTRAGVCCTQLATNLYMKALDSAKKAMPKAKKDTRHYFPRSFGEDLPSIGSQGFHYADDSQTECSGDYRDIEFNRDSYLFGSEVIHELSDEEADAEKWKTNTGKTDDTPIPNIDGGEPDPLPSPDLITEPEAKKAKKSFIGKIFKSRDRSEDGSGGKCRKKTSREASVESNKKKKVSSREASVESNRKKKASREASVECGLIDPSLPPLDSLIKSLEMYGSNKHNDDPSLSNVTRQSPVHLVYGKPPEIFVEECTTLPRDTPEKVAQQTSVMILDDVLRSITPEDPSYANLEVIVKTPVNAQTPDSKSKRNPKLARNLFDTKNKNPDSKDSKFFNFKFGSKNPKTEHIDDVPVSVEAPEVDSQLQVPEIVTESPPIGEALEICEEQTRPDSKKSKLTGKFFNRKENAKSKTGDSEVKVPKVKKPKAEKKGKDFKLKNPKFFSKLGGKMKKQAPYDEEQRYPSFPTFELPKLPESKSSTLNGHLYEGIPGDKPVEPEMVFSFATLEKKPAEPEVNIFKAQPIELKFDLPGPEDSGLTDLKPIGPVVAPSMTPLDTKPKVVGVTPAVEKHEVKIRKKEFDKREKAAYSRPRKEVESVEIPIGIPLDAPYDEQTATVVSSVAEEPPSPLMCPVEEPVCSAKKWPETPPYFPPFEHIDNIKNEIGVAYEPPEPEPKKIDKLKNMMGSFGSSVKSKVNAATRGVKDGSSALGTSVKCRMKGVKDFMKRSESPERWPPVKPSDVIVEFPTVKLAGEAFKPVDQTVSEFKETNLDDEGLVYGSATPASPPQVVISDYKVDPTLDDLTDTEHAGPYSTDAQKKKKLKRKFKLYVNKDNEKELFDKEMLPWSNTNRQRLDRFKSRATESFNQFADKMKQQKRNLQEKFPKKKPERNKSFDTYDYDFRFASDSELAPGTGVESLRRSKVYKDLDDSKERLEMYMSPVSGPLRPPRRKHSMSNVDLIYNQSMPALSMHRRLPPPPRPPPPKLATFGSVPVIAVNAGELSRANSLSSVWTRIGSRKRRQHVPPDIFYRNVRLGYRPKKSYVDHLQKSQQQYYTMTPLEQQIKCRSLGHLSAGGFPVPPKRTRTIYVKNTLAPECDTSPPPPPSRASMTSHYDTFRETKLRSLFDLPKSSRIPFVDDSAVDSEAEDTYRYNRERTLTPQPNTAEPVVWSPFTWKVKRCRSLTEIDVRERLKKKCPVTPSVERSISPSRLPPSVTANVELPVTSQSSTYDADASLSKLFNWFRSSTSLDKSRKVRQPSVDPYGKPPRPPLPSRSSASRASSPSSPLTNYSNISTYVNDNNPSNFDIGANFQGRPLPPPPVPPRPKLIPAHLANRKPVVTRDCGVDTSENGFIAYHCREKEIQVDPLDALAETLARVTPYVPSILRKTDSSTGPAEDEDEEEEEERTIVIDEERFLAFESNDPLLMNLSPTSIASIYTDAHSQVPRDSNWSDENEDEEATLNDDLSSLSSHYESLASPPPSQSWLHKSGSPTKPEADNLSSSITTDDYLTAMEDENNCSLVSEQPINSNLEEVLPNFENFQRAFQFDSKQSSTEDEQPELANTVEAKRNNRQSGISTESSDSTTSNSSANSTASSTSSSGSSMTTVKPCPVENIEAVKQFRPLEVKSDFSDGLPVGRPQLLAVPQNPSLRENISSLPRSTPKGGKPNKLYYTAHELYTTERDYVDVLRMLTEEFCEALKEREVKSYFKEFFFPLNQVKHVNEKLLEELSNRVLNDWDDNPTISDILTDICPYLKEYSIYIRNFNRMNAMLDEAKVIFPNFAESLAAFENSDRCRKLEIKSYLLKPIQRMPQYRLMLNQYLRHLEPGSEEFQRTKNAEKVVSGVLNHLDLEVKKAEKEKEFNELRRRTILTHDNNQLAQEGRELIKHGPLWKVSRKNVHQRYFILTTDVLFYLTPVMTDMIKLKATLPLTGMEVEIPSQPSFENEFIVSSVKRSFALLATDIAERNKWVSELRAAIEVNKKNVDSFKVSHNSMISSSSGNSSSSAAKLKSSISEDSSDLNNSTTSLTDSIGTRLGERAPLWIHDRHVTMCQLCLRQFTLLFRRHHCRACGHVVCADCSNRTYRLKYMASDSARVCDQCYDTLEQINSIERRDSCKGVVKSESEPNVPSNAASECNNLPECPSTPNPIIVIGGTSSLDRSNSDLKKNNRSNSCTEISLDSDLGYGSLARNTHYRLSSKVRKNLSSVLVEVSASDPSALMSGYLQRLTSTKKNWKRYWFVVKDMVMYTFKASEDVCALESLPLPGYKVTVPKESVKGFPAQHLIELSHSSQPTIYLFAESSVHHSKWLECLQESALTFGLAKPKKTS